ncbi:MAG: hypothetical protein RKO66_11995 [Candidatus Contendobacter sp.]|nr:hypothetical protein [Candidatus Contendobacter sp.]MDS4059661.1 hypothetical protein [Candidatus Contendobacter sp.]
MNKVVMIFTALNAYRKARGQETTTLRGVIAGALAAGAIAGLWWMGADLSADQVGLVMSAVYGVDTVLKIVLPDRLERGTHEKPNAAQNIGGPDPNRSDRDRDNADDRMQRMPADGGPREDSGDDPAPQPDSFGPGDGGSA